MGNVVFFLYFLYFCRKAFLPTYFRVYYARKEISVSIFQLNKWKMYSCLKNQELWLFIYSIFKINNKWLLIFLLYCIYTGRSIM